MSAAFESIEKGLREALAHARGESGATVHEVTVPEPDVRAIHPRVGPSQAVFARSIGVKKATPVNREQRRRRPEGPARAPLAPIEEDPTIVQRLLAGRAGGSAQCPGGWPWVAS
mgnify:FL=1|jgi:putative transcriptional regulator